MYRPVALFTLLALTCMSAYPSKAQTHAAPDPRTEDVHSVAMHPLQKVYLRGIVLNRPNPLYGRLNVFCLQDSTHRLIEVHTEAGFPEPAGSTYRIRGFMNPHPTIGKQFRDAQYVFQGFELTRWDTEKNAPWKEVPSTPPIPQSVAQPISQTLPSGPGREVVHQAGGINPLPWVLGCIGTGIGVAFLFLLLFGRRAATTSGGGSIPLVTATPEPTIIGERTEIALRGMRVPAPTLSLQVLCGIEGIDAFPLGAPSEATSIEFGRNANCSILMDNPLVSNRHGRFVLDAGGQWQIFLNNNKNTTYLTRRGVTTPLAIERMHPLEQGDILYLKDAGRPVLELQVHLENAVRAVGVAA